MTIRTAIFPVAGLGTRFLPATKAMPKEMLTLLDRPLIQHVVEEAREAGITRFIFVTSQGKEAMENHFDMAVELRAVLERRGKKAELDLVEASTLPPGTLAAVRQPQPLGLGHAVWCAAPLVEDEAFAVLLPDEVVRHPVGCLKQMVDAYAKLKTPANVVAVADVPRAETNRYGIIDPKGDANGPMGDKLIEAKGLVEKPKPEDAPSTLSLIGRYILQPSVMKALATHQTGAGGEIQLTDGIAASLSTTPTYGFRFEGERHDCGQKLGFILANFAYGLNDPVIGKAVREEAKKYFSN